MPESCRNWVTPPPFRALDRCGNPAVYILWGKLFPADLLGPRCYTCAVDQLTAAGYHSHSALQKDSGYAIYHIPSDDPSRP